MSLFDIEYQDKLFIANISVAKDLVATHSFLCVSLHTSEIGVMGCTTEYLLGVSGIFGAAIVMAMFLSRVAAPYGRYWRTSWGPSLPPRLGWVMMELPAVMGFLVVFVQGSAATERVPLFIGSLWFLHYLPRTLLYSWLLRSSTPFPLLLIGVGGLFNLVNSALNALAISHLSLFLQDAWLQDPRFILGVITFFLGMSINLHADHLLRRLRQPGDSTYYVPHGGFFRWVSCPNYLGEIIEWMGWGLLSWSWAGLGFLVFSCANLIPRALQHHRWYQATFPAYPPSRKAIFPGIL